MIDDIFGNPIVKMLLKKLPWFILRRFLTEDRLASFIQFSPRPTGEQVVFSGSDTPSIRIWLNIDNRGPFRVELDRLIIELWHKRFIGELHYLDRLVIEGGEDERNFGSWYARNTFFRLRAKSRCKFSLIYKNSRLF